MSKHIRKGLVIGKIENINENKQEFSIVVKLIPKWLDEQNHEKTGKNIFLEIHFDNQEIIEKYQSLCKKGAIIQAEGVLKNYRWQENDGVKRKKIILNITKYESNFLVLPIKKEEDMPYLNKVFILGNCYKANVKSTQNGGLMGIFPLLTKKTYKDKETNQLVDNDEWLDVFVFNDKLLSNYNIGENPMENKMIFIEGQFQSSTLNDETKTNVVISKRSDNNFIIMEINRFNNKETSNNTAISLEDDDLPF